LKNATVFRLVWAFLIKRSGKKLLILLLTNVVPMRILKVNEIYNRKYNKEYKPEINYLKPRT